MSDRVSGVLGERVLMLWCIRVDESPPRGEVDKRTCAHCPALVWVLVDLLAKVDAGEIQPTCGPCGAALITGRLEL